MGHRTRSRLDVLVVFLLEVGDDSTYTSFVIARFIRTSTLYTLPCNPHSLAALNDLQFCSERNPHRRACDIEVKDHQADLNIEYGNRGGRYERWKEGTGAGGFCGDGFHKWF